MYIYCMSYIIYVLFFAFIIYSVVTCESSVLSPRAESHCVPSRETHKKCFYCKVLQHKVSHKTWISDIKCF